MCGFFQPTGQLSHPVSYPLHCMPFEAYAFFGARRKRVCDIDGATVCVLCVRALVKVVKKSFASCSVRGLS